jgi:hypothetical protein
MDASVTTKSSPSQSSKGTLKKKVPRGLRGATSLKGGDLGAPLEVEVHAKRKTTEVSILAKDFDLGGNVSIPTDGGGLVDPANRRERSL